MSAPSVLAGLCDHGSVIIYKCLIDGILECGSSTNVWMWRGGGVELWLAPADGAAGLGKVRGRLCWSLA